MKYEERLRELDLLSVRKKSLRKMSVFRGGNREDRAKLFLDVFKGSSGNIGNVKKIIIINCTG